MTNEERTEHGIYSFRLLTRLARLLEEAYESGAKITYEICALSPKTKDGKPVLPGDSGEPQRPGGRTIRIAIDPPPG